MFHLIKKTLLSNRSIRKKIIRFVKKIQANTFSINAFSIEKYFVKDSGEKIAVYNGLRSFVRPNWEEVYENNFDKLKKQGKSFEIDLPYLIAEAEQYFSKMENILAAENFDYTNKKALEIGTGNMLKAHIFANKNLQTQVTGTDIDSEYFELEKYEDITQIRKKVSNHFSKKVTYETDNICASKYSDNTFDLIFSHDVLEHIHDIESAFNEMYRILKPGGICYHVYNPFFSYNGGHACCTTDHPWGHTVLNAKEFERYVKELKPEELDIAMAFYNTGLNKKTIHDFNIALSKTTFTEKYMLKETNINLLPLMLKDTLRQTKEIYATATLEDMLTPSIIIVLKK